MSDPALQRIWLLIGPAALALAGCVTEPVQGPRTVARVAPGTVDVDKLFTSQVTPQQRQQVEQMIMNGGLGHPAARQQAASAQQVASGPSLPAVDATGRPLPPTYQPHPRQGHLPHQVAQAPRPNAPYPGSYQHPAQSYQQPGIQQAYHQQPAAPLGVREQDVQAALPAPQAPAVLPPSVREVQRPLPVVDYGNVPSGHQNVTNATHWQPSHQQAPAPGALAATSRAAPPPPPPPVPGRMQEPAPPVRRRIAPPPPMPRAQETPARPAPAPVPVNNQAPSSPERSVPADRPTVTLKGIAGNPNSGRLAILDIQGVGVRFLRAGQSVKAPGASGPTVIRVRDISRDAVSVDVGNVSEELR